MLKKLARLFLLHEPEAPELGEPVWRQSALRIILLSGILFIVLVIISSSSLYSMLSCASLSVLSVSSPET